MASKADSNKRRPSSNPKSSRQQFSACGACRMRRVRCDLKDLQAANPSSGLTMCSNCQERGLKCVDEFAEVKAVKLLRRGRRLQQVEAVYGKSANDDDRIYSNSGAGLPHPSTIPRLRPEFLLSHFFQAFLTQRPIIDPLEFRCRFYEAQNGNEAALGIFGQLLCLVLSVWAVSFGVNEAGEPDPHAGPQAIRHRREKVNLMARELLQLIDIHGVLRKPTWDGVRVLFLTLPLTEDVQNSMERLVMHETAINQAYALSNLAPQHSVNSGQGEYMDAAVRARVMWYAYTHESLTTGLRGGRLLLSDDDLALFHSTLPNVGSAHVHHNALHFQLSHEYAKLPLRVSRLCRQVHATLTGASARRSEDFHMKATKLHEIWNLLGHAWEDFEGLRQLGSGDFMKPEEVERFVNGWQITIFECFNVTREALKQRMLDFAKPIDPSTVANGAQRASAASILSGLHAVAEDRCQQFARLVTAIAKRHLKTSFFQFDASFVRDGCFFATLLLANESGSDEEITTCLQALRDMRWGFSKSEEYDQKLRLLWDQLMAVKNTNNRDQATVQDPLSYYNNSSFTERVRNAPPPLMIAASSVALPDSAPNTALTEDGSWTGASSGPSSYGALSHRSSSGSPPFSEQSIQKSFDPNLILAQVGEQQAHGIHPYYGSNMAELGDTFAYSIIPPSASPLRSPHAFTPPHSGMSSASAPFSSTFDSIVFNDSVSPPGSARSAADAVKGSFVTLDKNVNAPGQQYAVNYAAGPYFVGQ